VDKKLSLVEHLDELRGRVLKSVIAVIVGAGLLYSFVEPIVAHLTRPVGELVFLAPQEAFVTNIKVAFYGGLLLSSPVVLYQAWRFVSAALRPREMKYAIVCAPLSLLFFGVGVSFAYFVIVPIGVRFLLGFQTDTLIPMISIGKYVSFVGTLLVSFGAIFELPLVMLFLTKIRVVTPEFLIRKRKHAVVLVFVAAAALTPPDVITQCMMAGPLILLYELGVLFSKFAVRERMQESALAAEVSE
jgi:sec-independent protein translocase protein TatC